MGKTEKNLEDLFGKGQFWPNVDWRRTKAYAMGLGDIYLNVKGREAQGIVEPGPVYDRIRERLIADLESLGAVGVGQSSWGPTVYGLVASADAAERVAAALRQRLDGNGAVIATPFSDRGALVSASWVRVGPD